MSETLDSSAFQHIEGDIELEAQIIRDVKAAIEGKPFGPVMNAIGRVMMTLQDFARRAQQPQVVSVPAPGGDVPAVPGAES